MACNHGVKGKKGFYMKVFDEQGVEMEVPSQEELAALKAQAGKAGLADEFENLKKGLNIPQGQTFSDYLRDLQLSANPNWRAARQAMDRMKEALRGKGLEVDDEGNIKSPQQQISPEDIENRARNAARNEIVNQHKEALLGKYDPETRKVVEDYYGKLIAGQELTIGNVEKVMRDAEKLARPESVSTGFDIRGGAPRIQHEPKSYADTPEGQEQARALFGDEAFSNVKK